MSDDASIVVGKNIGPFTLDVFGPPGNYIPAVWQFTGHGFDNATAAQLNLDGTLYVNWPAIEAWCAACPLGPTSGPEHNVPHMLIAIRDGKFACQP